MLFAGTVPVIALRGLAVFPEQTIHFEVGRRKSILALDEAMKSDQTLMLIPQRDITEDDPDERGLYTIGTVAKVKQVLKAQQDTVRVLVSGICRARVRVMHQTAPYMMASVIAVEETKVPDNLRARALRREANNLFSAYMELTEHPQLNTHLLMLSTENSGFLADSIAQNSGFDYRDKIQLLGMLNPMRRLESAVRLLRQEVEMLHLEHEIQERTKSNISQQQRDYFLREQIKVLRDELGEDDDAEFYELERRIDALKIRPEDREKLFKELERLKRQPYASQEGAVLRNYIDTVLDLPWDTYTKERLNVSAAEKILNKDHYGLEKVKDRILQTIAVRQMAPAMPPQILCLVGPPGVGKTSVAYSIAKCLNRKMARISLGGIHDEADIRGHRKTYVGAMPGRIMSAVKQAGSTNALLLLDEVDKMGSDYRGDPAAALLEVLDSEQNKAYRDHYLEIPFDLSRIMFIMTANTLDTIPRPLLDRMEVIEIGSYTDEEKLMIAKRHLIPKQLAAHGLKKAQLQLSDDAVREIIACYTRESGVRQLERRIAELCRKADMAFVRDENLKRISLSASQLEEYLGKRRYLPDRMAANDQVGLVTGLAWTQSGGETLEVEVNVMAGSGKLELTGNLGDVMKESAHAALSFIRANAARLGVEEDFYKTKDIHVHFPEGAVPKDGPSAGIAVCTAMVSALTGVSVRRDVAMTGEISLRGRVLAIGGLKEKTMAALRHGVHTVIIPQDNVRDLNDIDPLVRKALNFVAVSHIDAVLECALNRKCSENVGDFLHNIPNDVQNVGRKPAIRQ